MYIGRFAPSPTGELHFGSLLAALASYLDAKSNNGLWLLRIDDIDPPRELPGASDTIIAMLQAFGMQWDQDIVFQSERSHLYQQALNQLQQADVSYPCYCSRKEIKQRTSHSRYDRYCLSNKTTTTTIHTHCAWRFKNDTSSFIWQDTILGEQRIEHSENADFILKRSDSLWAYQLAVTVDDAAMGITHVVRGRDLLMEATKQLQLAQALNLHTPAFSHIPLVKNDSGQKLSKQNLAPALSTTQINHQLYTALQMLGQKTNDKFKNAKITDILLQATQDWNPATIPLEYSTQIRT